MKRFHYFLFILTIFSCVTPPIQNNQRTNLAKNNGENEITTIGYFTGEKAWVGNFDREEVYALNDYCLSLSDLTEKEAEKLSNQIILVKGQLEILKGRFKPAKTITNGRIYEPYKEPDKKFIKNPQFQIIQPDEIIPFNIQIIDYVPNAIHTEFENSPDEWHDGTLIHLIYQGFKIKELLIYHNRPEAEGSIWREKGASFKSRMPVSLLFPEKGISILIYSDSVKIEK